jgi:hypothetical protein
MKIFGLKNGERIEGANKLREVRSPGGRVQSARAAHLRVQLLRHNIVYGADPDVFKQLGLIYPVLCDAEIVYGALNAGLDASKVDVFHWRRCQR